MTQVLARWAAARHGDFAPLSPLEQRDHDVIPGRTFCAKSCSVVRFLYRSARLRWVSGIRSDTRALWGVMLRTKQRCLDRTRTAMLARTATRSPGFRNSSLEELGLLDGSNPNYSL